MGLQGIAELRVRHRTGPACIFFSDFCCNETDERIHWETRPAAGELNRFGKTRSLATQTSDISLGNTHAYVSGPR